MEIAVIKKGNALLENKANVRQAADSDESVPGGLSSFSVDGKEYAEYVSRTLYAHGHFVYMYIDAVEAGSHVAIVIDEYQEQGGTCPVCGKSHFEIARHADSFMENMNPIFNGRCLACGYDGIAALFFYDGITSFAKMMNDIVVETYPDVETCSAGIEIGDRFILQWRYKGYSVGLYDKETAILHEIDSNFFDFHDILAKLGLKGTLQSAKNPELPISATLIGKTKGCKVIEFSGPIFEIGVF